MASSAAETMFEVGAFTTMTPAVVADLMSTLSSPTPARAMTLRFLPAAIASASSLVAERIRMALASASAAEQGRSIGAVEVPDVEVGPERVDGSRGEFFCDQHDRFRHESNPSSRGRGIAATHEGATPSHFSAERASRLAV